MSSQPAHQKIVLGFRTSETQSKQVSQSLVRSQVKYMVPAQLWDPMYISHIINWVDRDRTRCAIAARARSEGLIISDAAVQPQSPTTKPRDP